MSDDDEYRAEIPPPAPPFEPELPTGIRFRPRWRAKCSKKTYLGNNRALLRALVERDK